jgi:hypothetical protein
MIEQKQVDVDGDLMPLAPIGSSSAVLGAGVPIMDVADAAAVPGASHDVTSTAHKRKRAVDPRDSNEGSSADHASASAKKPIKSAGRHALPALLQQFRSSRDINVLLLPTRTGSHGLNIIEATHVLMVEPVLNPAIHLQVSPSACGQL